MLDEKGTVAALKDAYKSGYIVAFTGEQVLIRAGLWAVEIDESQIPPKVMGILVEHIGVLPAAPAAREKLAEAYGVSLAEIVKAVEAGEQ
jgi:hypothetical protein